MANITTDLIKQLRTKTNAGMMDCKKILTETDGDLEKAVELLRKRGIVKAAKRSGREANEGVIKIELRADGKKAFMMEMNSETDFVSRNEKFIALANNIMNKLKETETDDLDEFQKTKLDDGLSVQEAVDELSGIIGEKIILKQIAIITANMNDLLAYYIHSNNKIGVVISLKQGTEELAKDLTMHIAAANPAYIAITDVPANIVDKERDIIKTQVLEQGKPENIADKIVEGKLRKFYQDICLLEQDFVKNTDQKIKDVLKEINKDTSVSKFVRMSIG